jgi:hypothetical protein
VPVTRLSAALGQRVVGIPAHAMVGSPAPRRPPVGDRLYGPQRDRDRRSSRGSTAARPRPGARGTGCISQSCSAGPPASPRAARSPGRRSRSPSGAQASRACTPPKPSSPSWSRTSHAATTSSAASAGSCTGSPQSKPGASDDRPRRGLGSVGRRRLPVRAPHQPRGARRLRSNQSRWPWQRASMRCVRVQ